MAVTKVFGELLYGYGKLSTEQCLVDKHLLF